MGGVFRTLLAGKYQNLMGSTVPFPDALSDCSDCSSSYHDTSNVHENESTSPTCSEPLPGCTCGSHKEDPYPPKTVVPSIINSRFPHSFCSSLQSHPGPVFVEREGVFRIPPAGKYPNYHPNRLPQVFPVFSMHTTDDFANPSPTAMNNIGGESSATTTSSCSTSAGCLQPSIMGVPGPSTAVELVPGLFKNRASGSSHQSRPAPACGPGLGISQAPLSGEFDGCRASFSPDDFSSRSTHVEQFESIACIRESSAERDTYTRTSTQPDGCTTIVGLTSTAPLEHTERPVHLASTLSRRQLTIYYQNVRGMRTKTNDFYLSAAACDYDIIVLTETWLRPDVLNSELTSHYSVFRCDRSVQTSSFLRGGGVLIAVKSSLHCSSVTLSDSSPLEQVAVTLKLPESTIYLCGIYIRPSSPAEVYSMHASAVQEICNLSSENDTIVVLGDYNLPGLVWVYDEELNCYIPTNASTEAESTFTETMLVTGLSQVNSLRNANDRILDLAFVSDTCDVEVIEPPSSLLRPDAHHKPFVLCVTINNNCDAHSPTNYGELELDFARCDYTVLNQSLSSINWLELLGDKSTDDATVLFYEKLFDVMNRIIPRKRRRLNTTKLPWWSSELRHLRNIVRKARKRFLRSKSQQDKENLKQLETRYNDCQAASFRSYIDRMELNLKENPSSFWTFVKSRKSSNCIPEQMKYRELSADSIEESANLFADFFSSVNNPNSPELSDASRQGIPMHDITLPSFNFTQRDVLSELEKLNVKKGPGTDLLPPVFLRECAESLKLPICLLFNRSLHERKFPAVWKTASITPIHKSGCRNSVENYRGISILCCIAKVFESMVHSVLYNATRHLISDYQHGFVKKRSTVSNLMCYTNFLSTEIEKRRQVDAVYFDFSKAFDKVPHRLAIEKLVHMGLPPWMTEWLQSYLTDRRAFVKINTSRSRIFYLTSGVPQGSILGPLIFVLFVNDLAFRLKSCMLLYADDLKIYKIISSVLDCHALQSDIDELLLWCSENGMQLNIKKCKSITFSRRQSNVCFEYNINGTSIDQVSSMNDLGVIVDKKLTFSDHISAITAKAFSVLGFVRRNSQSFQDVYTLKAVYCSLVRSVLEYAACVWAPYHTSWSLRIERVQRSFIRYALRSLPWNDPINLPDYESRCMLINLETLSSRRVKLKRLFVFDLVTGNVDCAALLNEVCFLAPSRHLRGRQLLALGTHRTTYGQNNPLTSCFQCFNVVNNLFDFTVSKTMFKHRIKNLRY